MSEDFAEYVSFSNSDQPPDGTMFSRFAPKGAFFKTVGYHYEVEINPPTLANYAKAIDQLQWMKWRIEAKDAAAGDISKDEAMQYVGLNEAINRLKKERIELLKRCVHNG